MKSLVPLDEALDLVTLRPTWLNVTTQQLDEFFLTQREDVCVRVRTPVRNIQFGTYTPVAVKAFIMTLGCICHICLTVSSAGIYFYCN